MLKKICDAGFLLNIEVCNQLSYLLFRLTEALRRKEDKTLIFISLLVCVTKPAMAAWCEC